MRERYNTRLAKLKALEETGGQRRTTPLPSALSISVVRPLSIPDAVAVGMGGKKRKYNTRLAAVRHARTRLFLSSPTGVAETAVAETAVVEMADADTGVADTGVADTGVVDTGVVEMAVVEMAVVDTGVADTAVADTGVVEMAVADTGVADTGVVEMGVVEMGVVEMCVVDTGVADTTVADTGVADTGVADTAVAEIVALERAAAEMAAVEMSAPEKAAVRRAVDLAEQVRNDSIQFALKLAAEGEATRAAEEAVVENFGAYMKRLSEIRRKYLACLTQSITRLRIEMVRGEEREQLFTFVNAWLLPLLRQTEAFPCAFAKFTVQELDKLERNTATICGGQSKHPKD